MTVHNSIFYIHKVTAGSGEKGKKAVYLVHWDSEVAKPPNAIFSQSYAGVNSLISTFRALILPIMCKALWRAHTHILKSIPFLAS